MSDAVNHLTCTNVSPYRTEDMNNGIPQFQCSACGAVLCDGDWSMHYNNSACIVSEEGGSEGLTHVSYCPNCGARVIFK